MLPLGDSSLLTPRSELDSEAERQMHERLDDVDSSFVGMPSPVALYADHSVDHDDSLAFPTPPGAYMASWTYPVASPMKQTSPNVTNVDGHDSLSALETMSSPTAAVTARIVSSAVSKATADSHEASDEAPVDQGTENVRSEGPTAPRQRETQTSGTPPTARETLSRQPPTSSTISQTDSSSGSSQPEPASTISRGRSSSDTSQPRTDKSLKWAVEPSLATSNSKPSSRTFVPKSSSVTSESPTSSTALEKKPSSRIKKSNSLFAASQTRASATATRGSFKGSSVKPDAILSGDEPGSSSNHSLPMSRQASSRSNSSSAPAPSGRSGVSTSDVTLGRSKGLSLREQTSTIDRLQKENFDLKLKIHFLEKALSERSEEGVEEIIARNVELKVKLSATRKDNASLKKKLAELETKLDAREKGESRPSTGGGSGSSMPASASSLPTESQYSEKEVLYLRECVKRYEAEVEYLKKSTTNARCDDNDNDNDCHVADDRKQASGEVSARKEMRMWKDLYEAEAFRGEQAEETVRRLEEENRRLRSEHSATLPSRHRRNVSDDSRDGQYRSLNARSFRTESHLDRGSAYNSTSSTLVDQLQRENAELKREVGAQASMLTSRNREKDKLYQEIEDLKLSQMRGERMHSIAGDAYDGSMSRLRPRSGSRTSAETPVTVLSDVERSVYEQKLGQLRMEVSQLKLHNQELEKRLDDCLDEMEQAELLRTNREKEFELELELASREMRGVSRERDVLSAVKTDLEADFEKLKQEAQQEISQLEANVESQRTELRQVKRDLGNRHESFSALQNEMRLVSEVMIRLEDDQRARTRQLVDLRGGLQDAHAELAALERSLRDANAKIERYAVQQESSQSEIAFLREEQDTDKIKIGDLESALKETRKALQDQEELACALEARVRDERHEHETQTSKAKHEAQRAADQLNAQLSSVEDEAHRLRKSISSAEAEVREWHDRYHEFEGQLRETLGDRNNSATGLLRLVGKLQEELEVTSAELEAANGNLADRERILRHRDGLLESAGLESRKLSEMLEKERQGRKTDRHHYEQLEKSTRQALRSATQQEGRVLELESARQADRRRVNGIETQYKDQLLERNNLLLALWNRLSTMCGTEWSHKHSQVHGKLPTIEVIASQLPGFSKNLLLAVKTVEGLVGALKSRIRNVEKDLWKEYQALERNVDTRLKRLDRLEGYYYGDGTTPPGVAAAENTKIKQENRALRTELKALQTQDMPPRASRSVQRGMSGNMPLAAMTANPESSQVAMTAALTRDSSLTSMGLFDQFDGAQRASMAGPPTNPADQASEQRWIHRLRELEKRLKSEREARIIDRSGARKRLEEGRAEYEELKQELERERLRKPS